MIEYKGIKFPTVDSLIEYMEKAEGFIKPPKLNITFPDVSGPPPFYPRQQNPWLTPIPDPGIRINEWHPPLSPTCTWTLTDGAKAGIIESNLDSISRASND